MKASENIYDQVERIADVRIEMGGKRLGRLLVKEYAYTKGKRAYWSCLCDCGNEVIVIGKDLRQGKTLSCGCFQIEQARKENTTHGKSKTRLHRIWSAMKNRTTNPNDSHYKYYGGKGIRVCEAWQDFEVFQDWAVKHGYQDDLSIERLSNELGYNPRNCTWIPMSQQSRNRTNVKVIHEHYVQSI